MSTVEVHILTNDHDWMIPWAVRHYATFATRIILHDGGPTHDPAGDAALLESGGCQAEVHPWETKGQLNDELAMQLKNTCWLGTDADWVICVDCDELVYFPKGTELATYERVGACMVKPYGYEMYSETMPEGPGQIYEYVNQGAREDQWYSKPVLFSPKRVAESGFGIGAHEAQPVLKSGRRLTVGQNWPKAHPPCYLMHFKSIGTLEQVAARYDATRKRLSQVNERHRWGNFDTGAKHSADKRAYILARLQRVV